MRVIFVFGSNTQGRHGKGAALHARTYYGAVYGRPKGLHGNSYAVVTKDLKIGKRSVSLESIDVQIKEFNLYTLSHPELLFIVSPLGMGLAGFKRAEIAPMFKQWRWNENVFFSHKFLA